MAKLAFAAGDRVILDSLSPTLYATGFRAVSVSNSTEMGFRDAQHARETVAGPAYAGLTTTTSRSPLHTVTGRQLPVTRSQTSAK